MLSNWLIKSNEKPPTTISMLQLAQCSALGPRGWRRLSQSAVAGCCCCSI